MFLKVVSHYDVNFRSLVDVRDLKGCQLSEEAVHRIRVGFELGMCDCGFSNIIIVVSM